MPEFFGDVATVNGKAWPNLNVDRTLYRFRIANGSNARFYNLSLSNGAKIIQIGTDGGMLNTPVKLRTLLLAPGERADVLIDFSDDDFRAGATIILQNDAPAPYPAGGGGVNLPDIMRFTVNASPRVRMRIPRNLRVNNPQFTPITVPPIRQRYLTLTEILGPGGPLVGLLNYVYWAEPLANPALIERPAVNTVEQWNIINLTGDAHPIHLHLVQFQILNTRLIVPFGALAAPNLPFGNSFTGRYVWHCQSWSMRTMK